jgi:hypothetical protein
MAVCRFSQRCVRFILPQLEKDAVLRLTTSVVGVFFVATELFMSEIAFLCSLLGA